MALVRTPYIGRLAPSPTGLLHLGHAATFWTAYTRARDAHGTLLFRNEDLDLQRSRPEFVDAMLEDLAWLGITWQPPMISQSQRLPNYQAAFERLLECGAVYPCTCSRKDLSGMVQAPHDEDDEPLYDGRCRPASAASPLPFNLSANYRFRVPDGESIRFEDGNLGAQAFAAGSDFGDFLIWRKPADPRVEMPRTHKNCPPERSSAPAPNAVEGPAVALTENSSDTGLPSYQLACAVDDAAMGVTEVVRGADLLKSAARQILLQRALGLPAVDYFHTALLRDEHGVRLAKRHDALALRTLRELGLTPADVRARFS